METERTMARRGGPCGARGGATGDEGHGAPPDHKNDTNNNNNNNNNTNNNNSNRNSKW